MNISIATEMQDSFNQIINQHGEKCVVYQHSATIGGTYDEKTLTLSGSVIGSMFWLPVSDNRNGEDYKYLEEGVIRKDDIKIFYKSGISLGDTDIVAIPTAAGSYSVVKRFDWSTNGAFIYHKAFLRRYVNG